jgi:general secretion pathway protein D
VDDAWQAEEEEDAIPSPAGLPPPEGRLQSLVLPKISLRDVPLAEAVEAIGASVEAAAGEGEGFNLLLLDGPEEERRVTLHLAHATLSRALQLLARAVDLDWEIDGDTVVLSSAARNRLRTKIFPISRATVLRLTNLRGRDGDGKDQIAREERLLREFLQNAGVDFHGTAGSGLAFDGSALVIAQNGRNLERVENILRRYAGSRQVEIEAKFIEVQQGALEELQLRLSLAGGHGGLESGDTLRSLVQAFSPRGSATADGSIVLDSWPTGGSRIDRIPIPNRVPQFPNAANLGQLDQPLVNVLSGAQTGLLLRALEQQSGSDLMSAPRLTVLPGKTAEIIVAQEFRYPEAYDEIQSSVGSGSSLNASTSAGVTITAGTPRNFQTRNVGVEMAVTPTVEDDGHISLRLEPSVTEFEGFVEYGGVSVAVSGGATVTVPSGFFQPIFSTRRIRTEVTIDDGATVVMGGLTREEVKEVRDKVPILGDIPLLGKFFRSKGTSSQKRNLLIFVTAKLIPLDPAR